MPSTDNLAKLIREAFLEDWKRLRQKDVELRQKLVDNRQKRDSMAITHIKKVDKLWTTY